MVRIRVNPTNENIRVDVNNVDSDIDIRANSPRTTVNTGVVGDKYYTDLAKEWAIKMDGKVMGEDYSSKYWAQESKGYAEQAEEIIQSKDEILAELEQEGNTQIGLIENAGTEQIGLVESSTDAQIERIEDAGDTQITNITNVSNTNIATINGLIGDAQNAANAAANSAQSASNSATSASNSSTSASNSANSAQTSATGAANSASSASDSATAAATSAQSAAGSATSASNSATAASGSASSAQSSATSASNSASSASSSATSASNSATSAASSASAAATSEDNAEIWAEGTDEEVQALGGIHSAKGWADVSSAGQIQADWEEEDTTSKAYIRNKPSNFASSISELTDVDLTGLSNGDVLVYDSTSQEWKAEAQSGGVTDVEVNGESVVISGVAEIDLTGYQEKLTAGTDLEILTGGGAVVYELPQGYAQIEYIESSGAQALNTGVSGYSTVTLDAQGSQTTSASQVVVGTYSGFNSFFGQYAGTNTWSGNSTSNNFNTGIPYTTRTKLVINFGEGGVYSVTTEGGTTYTSSSSGRLLTSANFYLFRTGTGNAYYSRTKIYYCKIEQSGVKKAELIPAIRLSDNAIGMYDLVQEVFRTNVGTGTFIAGEKVVESSIINFTNESGFVTSSELAEVATTGDYGDLINTPTIGNGTIIVNEGATEKGRFTLNQNGDTTINLTQVGAGMITFMQDGKQSGRMSANRATDMTITLKGLYDYESVNADMIGDNLEQANNNRVTGFSTNDYIVMREPITLPQYWEYDVDFSIYDTAESIGDEQYIFSDVNNTFALKENEDAQLYETFTLYVNGTPVASDIEAESAYYNIKFIKGMDENYNIVGNGDTLQCYVYVGFSSGQSAQKELVGSFTSSTAPTTIQTIFGVNSNHAKPLSDGSYIDFTKCFIDGITRNGNTVTKTRVWDGLVKTIDTKVNTWDLDSYVKSVNNELPDANGNVDVKGLYDYYVVNANKQGSIVIDGAIASGFSANSLVWKSYNFPTTNVCHAINTEFSVNSLGSDQIIFSDSYNNPNFAVKINGSDNCLSVAVSGTWYSLTNTEISEGETYQIKLTDWIYTDGQTAIGTYLYVYSPSLNEVIYNGLVTSNAVTLGNKIFYFGTGNSGASPLDGSINLSLTYYEENNVAGGGTFDSGWYTIWTGATPTIDTKADTDLGNITDTGKITIADMGMPSTQYKTLTLGASGTSYIAPADGWFVLRKQSGSGAVQYLNLYNRSANDLGMTINNGNAALISTVFIPAKKGQTVEAVYNYSGTTNFFRFIYAEGSKSEAT